MSVLIFAPHPDDDLIGCGGSIAKHLANGRAVHVVYMTSGNAGSRVIDKESLAQIREEEATRAAELLGVRNLTFLRHDDGYLKDTPELAERMINLVREHRPEYVYLPHEDDGHPDHQETHRLVVKALAQAAGPWFQGTTGDPWAVPTVLAYEVWTPLRHVSYLEDITDVSALLRQALECHKSQLGEIDYWAMAYGLAQYRGVTIAPGRLAEAFTVISSPTSSFTAR
ncbi:PIG-L deacetylase family protein [Asanoa sp. NPDC049518]|uniref:PIG-L deacetylase family protein n=1 Tax=unclassified Asanoa TaxID=2685164 RepID=UPI00343EA77C